MRRNIHTKIHWILFLMISITPCAFAQEKVVRELVAIKRPSPITVEVVKGTDQFTFFGENNSFIPYLVEVEFSQMNNLEPETSKYKVVVKPGRTSMFDLRIRQKDITPSYQYKYHYAMGDPQATPDIEFPYLIPLTKNKKVSIVENQSPGGETRIVYRFAAGDTIFAMRKGKVTGTSENMEVFHVIPGSIEVYHQDGTLASYHMPESTCLVKEGQFVYPGQPLGMMKQTTYVTMSVFRFLANNRVGPVSIKYTVDGTALLPPEQVNGVTPAHPAEIIEKELNKAEVKKWKKGTLY